jgi:uncharacterized OB-fold protein
MACDESEGAALGLVRPLPLMTPENEFFWRSGSDGRLRFKRCRTCGRYQHPPRPRCDACLGDDIYVDPVSGRGTLATYTVNHQAWLPDFPPPYLIAIVELEEQSGLRLTTNIVKCDEADLSIGMPLRVVFELCEDVYLPLFEPVR